MIAVIMGVSGCGKTTVGRALAAECGWEFLDADDFHPASNVEKMAKGVPLTDEDRRPWLESLRDRLQESDRARRSVVLACSALKQAYRDLLASGVGDIRWIHLKGTPDQVRALMARRKGHFMNPALLDSQFAALQEPGDAITVDVTLDVASQVRSIRERLAGGGGLLPA